MITRRQAILAMATAASSTLAPFAARAQDSWAPSKPIRLLVPYAAGSTTDIVARQVGMALGERIQQSLIVENRTGAGGIVALRALQQAAPDGHVVGKIVSGNVIQPWVMKDMPLDVRNQFVPLTLMYAGQYVLLVPQSSPIRTFDEFLANARANPRKVFFGSSGFGTTTHLAGELLKQTSDVDIVHVPFKGSPEVHNAILGGQVQACFDLFGTARQFIDSGQLRPLAVTGARRAPWLPEVPAIAESIPGYEVLAWTGFALPMGTPTEIADALGAEFRAVLKTPDLEQRLMTLGIEPGGNSQIAFQKFIEDEYEKWGRTVQKAGITPT